MVLHAVWLVLVVAPTPLLLVWPGIFVNTTQPYLGGGDEVFFLAPLGAMALTLLLGWAFEARGWLERPPRAMPPVSLVLFAVPPVLLTVIAVLVAATMNWPWIDWLS